jgi:hypothetical protein
MRTNDAHQHLIARRHAPAQRVDRQSCPTPLLNSAAQISAAAQHFHPHAIARRAVRGSFSAPLHEICCQTIIDFLQFGSQSVAGLIKDGYTYAAEPHRNLRPGF